VFEVKGCFVFFSAGRPVTQTKGVAIKHPGLPLVHVNFPTTAADLTQKFKGGMCDVDLYVDKILHAVDLYVDNILHNVTSG
jgi:hypothetical protein